MLAMVDPLSNPHDKFFKDLFSRHEAARDFLQYYLPADISALLDLSDLEIRKDSFIDPDLQEHFSDILYKVHLHSGQDSYIYVLLEHKSYPDPEIALQLLKYMVRIWEQSRKQHEPLLPVFPVVIYHGQQRWQVASEFSALFADLPDALRQYVPEYRYLLTDLSQYSDEEIKGQVQAVILQMSLLLLKYSQRPDVEERLVDIFRLLGQLSEQETALEYLETALRYIVGSTDKVSAEALGQIVQGILQEGAAVMPTIAEQWLEQGREQGLELGLEKGLERGREQGLEQGLEKGLEQGREQGLEQGRQEAALDLLLRYLATRFEVQPDAYQAALTGCDMATLTRLSQHAFEANNLAAFEAALADLTANQPGEA
jgi:predicted transposase/invertase (TIGR01784 family)